MGIGRIACSLAITLLLVFLRAFLWAFSGTLGWLLWAVFDESNRSCFRGGHYAGPAAVALVVVVALEMTFDASRRLREQQSGRPFIASDLIGGAATTAGLMLVGLLIAIWFAAAVSCSA
jgi:hypothetical protein